MASGTPSAHKRSSLHRLSHTILSLASPPFSRVSFDPQGFSTRRRASPLKTHAPGLATTASLDKHDGQSAYSPSIISAVDSQLSSPYTPLLPSPGSLAPTSPPAVPPTTNDLSEDEKMKLMRTVRKLSRVLGEIPAVEEEDAAPARLSGDEALGARRPTSPGGAMMRSASASAKKAWRRSLTFGASSSAALLEPRDIRHARSLSALRPSLSMPRAPPSGDALGTPSSPITFARPDSALSQRDVSECGLSSSAPEPRSSDAAHGLRRRDSTASSVLLADQNVEQVQRARAAKLSRHFGTSIPPEVLRRAASPPPPPPPPASPLALYPLPTQVLSAEHLPRRSASLRRRPARPRPASLDIRPSSGLFSAPTSPLAAPSPSPQSGERRTLKRSKSLWTRRPKTADGSENGAAGGGGSGGGEPSAPGLSEKQRIQNVKRAKKMAQLFGDNPPSALFQITNFAGAVVEPGSGSTEAHRYERDSLATIISISTTSLSPSLSATNKVKLRDSFISVVTTSSEVSGLVLAEQTNEDEEQEDWSTPQEPDAADPPPAPPLPVLSPIPVPRRKSVRPSTSPPTNPNRASRGALPVPSSPLAHVPCTPPTPPPFSNFIPPPELRPATAPPSSPAPHEFQTRRRRAAKLSKFFGVDVNALADALPPDVRAPHAPPPSAGGGSGGGVTFDDVALVYREAQPHDASLVVAEATRRRFLGMDGDDHVEERDMVEIIDRLRRLRSS